MTPDEAPLRHYVCVVAKTHVVEPYELPPEELAAFCEEAVSVARAVASVARPVKMNYEIHWNTLPHLYLHLFPRSIDDAFVGGPIDPRHNRVLRTDSELAALKEAARRFDPKSGTRHPLKSECVSTNDKGFKPWYQLLSP